MGVASHSDRQTIIRRTKELNKNLHSVFKSTDAKCVCIALHFHTIDQGRPT